ncbi:MAG: SDR family NAD(P)-dependent oxidoreductase, partial [Psychromonas sp.]
IWIKTIPADLSELHAARKLFEKISDLDLSVDYLINNAGFGKFCEFSGESFETYHKMLLLNINALVELTHLCLPVMINKNSGGIINVASIGSFQPLPYQTVYGASKAFVLSFSEALSGELLNTEIRVMALCPGTTESRFMENASADTSNMNLAPADKVVKSALTAYAKNKMYTVSGKINYLVSLIPRLVSRKRTVKIVVNMFKDNVLGKKSA